MCKSILNSVARSVMEDKKFSKIKGHKANSKSKDVSWSTFTGVEVPNFTNHAWACMMCPFMAKNKSDLIGHVNAVHGIIAGKDFESGDVCKCKHCFKLSGKKENGVALFFAHVFNCKQSRKKKTPDVAFFASKSRKRKSLFEISTSESDTSIVDVPRFSKRLKNKQLRNLAQTQKPNISPLATGTNENMKEPNVEISNIFNQPLGFKDKSSTSNVTDVPIKKATLPTKKTSQSSSQESEPKKQLRGNRRNSNERMTKPKVLLKASSILAAPIYNKETAPATEKEISQNSYSDKRNAHININSSMDLAIKPISRLNERDVSPLKVNLNTDDPAFIKLTSSPQKKVVKIKLDYPKVALNKAAFATNALNDPTASSKSVETIATDSLRNTDSSCPEFKFPMIIANPFSVPQNFFALPFNINNIKMTESKSKPKDNLKPSWFIPYDDDRKKIRTNCKKPISNLNIKYTNFLKSSKEAEKILRKKVGLTRWTKSPNEENSRWGCSKCHRSFGFRNEFLIHICGGIMPPPISHKRIKLAHASFPFVILEGKKPIPSIRTTYD